MSYTIGTTHYNLPLTTNNDKRDWVDTNQAFTDVDAALYGAVSNTSTQGEEITALDTRLTTAEGNISTNAGNITALDSRLTTAEGNITSQGTQIADVRSDAEDMICAYNEATATSTHAYAIGDYFIYNDVLYRVTASISVGDTIVPDINCTTTNVTTEIATAGSDAVDMICTVTENTTTATRNYAVGDYFILNNTLYRATAVITTGTTIVPNINCVSTVLASDVNLNRVNLSNMICAYVENTTTSTHSYAVGNFFIYNDMLYRVTVPISIGNTITPGANCIASNVTSELTSRSTVLVGQAVSDGVKTVLQLLAELYSTFDSDSEYLLRLDFGNNSEMLYHQGYASNNDLQFSLVNISGSSIDVTRFRISSSCEYKGATINTNGTITITDKGNNVPTDWTFSLYRIGTI